MRRTALLLIVIACLGALACKPRPVTVVTMDQMEGALAKPDTLVLDVNEPPAAGANPPAVEGAVQIPFSMLPFNLETVPKDRNIYIVANDWGTVLRAANLLVDSGYKNVVRVRVGEAPPPPR